MTFAPASPAENRHAAGFAIAAIWLPALLLVYWCVLAFNPAAQGSLAGLFRFEDGVSIVSMATAALLMFAALAGALVAWSMLRTQRRSAALLFATFALGCSLLVVEQMNWFAIGAGALDGAVAATSPGSAWWPGGKTVLLLVFCAMALALTSERMVFIPRSQWKLLAPRLELVPLAAMILLVALASLAMQLSNGALVALHPIRWTMAVVDVFVAWWLAAYAVQKLIEAQALTASRARVVSTLGRAHYALRKAKVRARMPGTAPARKAVA